MSLDINLNGPTTKVKKTCLHCNSEYEVDEYEVYFEANITHNLNKMADAAGIYKHLWRPEELGITQAKDLIEPIEKGLADMKSNPGKFMTYNATNGWGTYDQFIPWIERYLNALKEFPESEVSVSR